MEWVVTSPMPIAGLQVADQTVITPKWEAQRSARPVKAVVRPAQAKSTVADGIDERGGLRRDRHRISICARQARWRAGAVLSLRPADCSRRRAKPRTAAINVCSPK